MAILSNKGQEDSYIYVELVIEMKDRIIISTKVYARRAENNPIAFEAYINRQNRIKNVEIDDIFTLLEIIESGKVKFLVSSLTFTLKKLT